MSVVWSAAAGKQQVWQDDGRLEHDESQLDNADPTDCVETRSHTHIFRGHSVRMRRLLHDNRCSRQNDGAGDPWTVSSLPASERQQDRV